MNTFDAYSSRKPIFDDELFEIKINLNTAVFLYEVYVKKMLHFLCLTPSFKDKNLCITKQLDSTKRIIRQLRTHPVATEKATKMVFFAHFLHSIRL